jgi:UDP-N-acetylmuramyl pentapeptide phosphotransferase/UDP-N-acetylglucosamine-1-phosphate transferase
MSVPGPGALVIAVSVAVALAIAILRKTGLGARLMDRPNARSLHEAPRPRIGGLAMVPVILVAFCWVSAPEVIALVISCTLIFAVSLADDLRSRPVVLRLAAHLVAALLAVARPDAIGLLAAFAIVWSANLFNFMDGADGLAGGMAAIGFAALSWVAADAGRDPLALACLVVAAAALGFLAWNFPPARVFMGDAGSVPLGFLAGVLSWQGIAEGAWTPAFPLMVFSPFWVDATATILGRVFRGVKFWEAHRSHYYQRLVLAGWSHRRLATCAYSLMLACALAAIVLERASASVQGAIMCLWVLAFAALALLIERRCAMAR